MTQLANAPSEAAFDHFVETFRRSMVGIETLSRPPHIKPGESFLTTATHSVELKAVLTPDGRKMLRACADPAVFSLRFAETKIGAHMLGEQLLRAAVASSEIDGVLVCSASSFQSIPISREEAQLRLARPLLGIVHPAKDNIVPPGHEVHIVYPISAPRFVQMKCGAWVLHFGSPEHIQWGIDQVRSLVASVQRGNVLWIMAGDILRSIANPSAFVEACAQVRKSSPNVGNLAVFPDDVQWRFEYMQAFKERGFGVHFGGPDRACFVEVLKPDGSITIGMPGAAF